MLRWDRAVLAVALGAIAVATNPDQTHFVHFVKEYTQRGLGFLPGALSSWDSFPTFSAGVQDAGHGAAQGAV